MTDIVQIPFSAFKLIDIGQSVALDVYQALYNDHAEPVGMIATIQAMGLITPSEKAVSSFNERWRRGSTRRKLHNTSLEVVTGKSSTSAEMAKTPQGETTVMVLSFLTDTIPTDVTAKVVRHVISKTPNTLVQIKPRAAQVDNVLAAIEGQTSCVSWQADITEAENAVFENPQVWISSSILPPSGFDIPAECLGAFYLALCSITSFPKDYRCILQTSGSLVVPFVLAHTICGLRVCVLLDGEVIYGNISSEQWQVRLERSTTAGHATRVKLGRRMESVEDILIQDEVGVVRANKVATQGIGKAATLGQGLADQEAWDIAALAIAVSISTFSQWKRELLFYDDDDDSSSEGYDSAQSEKNGGRETPNAKKKLVPIKAQLSSYAVALWWDCSAEVASRLLEQGEKVLDVQPLYALWNQLKLGKESMGKIADFGQLTEAEQVQKRARINRTLSRNDYSRLIHILASQLSMICFLGFNDISKANIRVRARSEPQNTVVGKAIKCMKEPAPLGQTDAMCSWYQWIKGKAPKDLTRLEALSTEGFLIYRSLLLDLSLTPELCEMVTIEPGHLSFEDYRPEIMTGYESGYTVIGNPSYTNVLKRPAMLRSKDRTGDVKIGWNIDEVNGTLESTLNLQLDRSGVQIVTSIYQIVEISWRLMYGDRSIGCRHDEESAWSLLEGEEVEELTPGNPPSSNQAPSSWRAIKIYRSYENKIGQVACLLSADANTRGMVRREACLRCCVSTANKMRLDFIID